MFHFIPGKRLVLKLIVLYRIVFEEKRKAERGKEEKRGKAIYIFYMDDKWVPAEFCESALPF